MYACESATVHACMNVAMYACDRLCWPRGVCLLFQWKCLSPAL